MRAIYGWLLLMSALLGSIGSARAFSFCPDVALAPRSLYVLKPAMRGPCWAAVRNDVVLAEGDEYLGAVPKFSSRGGKAQFAYVIAAPKTYRSALVVKEREFRPVAIFGAEGKKWTKLEGRRKAEAARDILLERRAIESRCGNKEDLDKSARRGQDKVRIDLTSYNRYHDQSGVFISTPDEIRRFHFRYEMGEGCIETNSNLLNRRAQYVFRGMTGAPQVSWFPFSFLTPAYAENDFYTKLKVRNIHVDGKNALVDANGVEYQMLRFEVNPSSATRTELTISDLEYRLDGSHRPSTWHIEWAD